MLRSAPGYFNEAVTIFQSCEYLSPSLIRSPFPNRAIRRAGPAPHRVPSRSPMARPTSTPSRGQNR